MEHLIISALTGILSTIWDGIVGNRADAVVTIASKTGFKNFIKYLKAGGKPVNHDLQKAVKRSLLQALHHIALEYQEELGGKLPNIRQHLPFHNQRRDLRWVNQKIAQLAKEIKQVDRSDYVEMTADLLDKIGFLVASEGTLTVSEIQQQKEQLLNAVLIGDEPQGYIDKLRRDKAGLYELVCVYFAEEIKTNERVRDIFQGQLLAQINAKLTGQPVTIQDLENSLNHVSVQLQEIRREQQQGFDTVVEAIRQIQLPNVASQVVTRPDNTPNSGATVFLGREEDLKKLHQQFQKSDRVAVSAVAGMGGVGKTELAIQYSSLFRNFYDNGIFFLNARLNNPAAQILEFAQLYLGLEIPQQVAGNNLKLAQQVEWCWQHWPNLSPAKEGLALVVFDDVQDLASIREFLPRGNRFRVLLTTRSRGLDASFFELPLDVLSPEAALELLQTLAGAERIERQKATAEELCQWLGYLPLGVELVGRYLAQDPDLSLTEMLARLKAQSLKDEAIAPQQASLMTSQRGVEAAIALSWQELDPATAEVGRLLSLFAPAMIPWEFVEDVGKRLNWTEQQIKQGRKQLYQRHLIQRVDEGQYKLHPLIREFVRSQIAESAQADEMKRAIGASVVKIAWKIPPTPTLKHIQEVTPAIPHLAEVAANLNAYLSDEDLIWPFLGLGWFYKGQGLYELAESWHEQCVSVARKRLGEEHPDVAMSLNELALLYHSQGRYEEAEPLLVQALELFRRLLGEEHLSVATSLNNLAGLYESQGRYEQAEPLYLQALELLRRLLGEEHPDVAASLNNLAGLYESQGRYEQAEPLFVQALDLKRRLLGEEHPSVATSLNNLAGLYESQGRYEQAEPLFVQALELFRRLLGEEHPDVATSLNNLAYLYKSQGRYEQAKPLFVQALELRRRLLGEEHPDVARSLNNLAYLYDSQGRYEQAEPLYLQALELWRRLLGEEHPDVARSLNNLAALYYSQRRYEEAEPLLVQALEICDRCLGANHPHTISTRKSLENLRRELENNSSE